MGLNNRGTEKGRREAAKRRKRVAKESRREMHRRDKEMTIEYGGKGHGSCGRKRRYVSEAHAMDSAASYVALGSPELRAYHCEMCGGWHLTKLTNWREDE